jgi:hypothetical protein
MTEYAQIKVAVKPALAEAYKDACKKAGVKMAADIAAYMAKQTDKLDQFAKKQITSTRMRRRKEIARIADRVEAIAELERTYMENIPDNLKGGQAFSDAEEAVAAMEEAVDRLREVYG